MNNKIIDLVRIMRNKDKDVEVNDIGIEYRNRYFQSIKYINTPVFICPSCNFETISKESFEQCSKCLDYNVNKTVENIETACKDYTFAIQSFEDIDCTYDCAEMYKMEIGNMYAFALFGIRYEINDWSSTPPHQMVAMIIGFEYSCSTQIKKETMHMINIKIK